MKAPAASVEATAWDADRGAEARATALLAAPKAGRAVTAGATGSVPAGATVGRAGKGSRPMAPEAPGAGLRPASALLGSQLRFFSASAASCVGVRAGTLLTKGLGAFVT